MQLCKYFLQKFAMRYFKRCKTRILLYNMNLIIYKLAIVIFNQTSTNISYTILYEMHYVIILYNIKT